MRAEDEFVLQLWKSRTEFIPLVYEQLLAIDERQFVTTLFPNKIE